MQHIAAITKPFTDIYIDLNIDARFKPTMLLSFRKGWSGVVTFALRVLKFASRHLPYAFVECERTNPQVLAGHHFQMGEASSSAKVRTRRPFTSKRQALRLEKGAHIALCCHLQVVHRLAAISHWLPGVNRRQA